MKDDVFIDTNLWIYLYSDEERGLKVKHIVDGQFKNIVISTQVLGELFNVLTKKQFKNKDEAKDIVAEMSGTFRVAPINQSTVMSAIKLHKKHEYAYWDSLIIASALENNCKVLYSEDFQNGQIIDKTLKILNP